MDRLVKQILITIVFALIVGGTVFGMYSFFRVSPTCSDHLQNQGEQGVDCGPVCGNLCAPAVQPLQIKGTTLLKDGGNRYDAVAQVYNPNSIYGSDMVHYELSYIDAVGGVLKTDAGAFYILPQQTRVLVKTAVSISGTPAHIELKLTDAQWQKVDPGTAVDFTVGSEQYQEQPDKSAVYRAVLTNRSDFDFDTVDVAVLLSDQSGTVIGVGTTTINTLLSRAERAFIIQWPFLLPAHSGRPAISISATTNIFENTNFIKRYGSQEKFQEFFPQ